MIFNWECSMPLENQLYKTIQQWSLLSGTAEEISLAYSREWLERDIANTFLSICNTCRTASMEDHCYQMAFSFCAWAYSSVHVRPLIPTILAFAIVPGLRVLEPPSWTTYDLLEGMGPTEKKISDMVIKHALPPDESSELNLEQRQWEISSFNKKSSLELKELVGILMRRWPSEAPVVAKSREWLFDIQELERDAGVAFQTWLQNSDLFSYIRKVQQVLNQVRLLPSTRPTVLYKFQPSKTRPHSVFDYIAVHQLFTDRDAPNTRPPPSSLKGSFHSPKDVSAHYMEKLRGLVSEFRHSNFLSHHHGKSAAIQQQYADDLEKSLQSLEDEVNTAVHNQGLSESHTSEIINRHYTECKEHLQATYGLVRESLLPSTQSEKALCTAGLWPCLSRTSLLGVLSFGSNVVLTAPWRRTLNSVARALLTFQRACRLKRYFQENNLEDFTSELRATVTEPQGDDDEQMSIQLLIQVDGDFLARPIQIAFMKEMISPSSGRNAALQLNMGEGKSSVIVPMVAAALADSQKLVRVVVLKQLSSSMFQLLVHRLGGLANRRIFYMPFSRSPPLTLDQAEQIQNLFLTCVKVRGVLVIQPEHILSFKLMGLDRKFSPATSSESTNLGSADRLMESQRWLFDHILDESDEILHVRYQLTYTVGQQQSLQGSPDRWKVIEQTLMLVRKHAQAVKRLCPDGIEVLEDFSGSYPRIRVLRDEAGAELVRLIAGDISSGALEQWSLAFFSAQLRSLALSYITKLDIPSEDVHLLEDHCKKSELWNTLLILRGLLAHGILLFVLKEKRWRVDYGLDPSRSMLAVPYRAKDVPSLRAEFSHPDVAILLTYLSYYWRGLSGIQLEQCFDLLFKQDNPGLQYDKWVRRSQAISDQLRHLNAINRYDLDQRAELHRILQYNQSVIDFFLSQVVFPREAKEFPKKMATSGWDLAERKHHVTTGFSGTKDGGYLLPTSINQDDPLSQSSTNAKVLGYLLQPENDHYQCMHQRGQPISEQSFLRMLSQEPKIRVLLDVGAQILKLSNEEVAAEWLDSHSDPHVLAIVFFGLDDEPYVRTRSGVVEALVSSPFRQQLDRCLLYLDDVHTRGTDFKLPLGTRAAVTLGPKVTKDRLLQGCMRMRKLGYGHSVMFFAPPDVHSSIRTAAGLHEYDSIRVKDILLWTMLESCMEVVHRISQWTQQGIDHSKREKAWMKVKESPDKYTDLLESAWVQDEAQSLEDMYALVKAGSKAADHQLLQNYPDISERYLKWAPSTSFSDTRIEQEQEREVIVEIEAERKVERPPKATAATPHVHDHVRALVRTGVFKPSSAAFVPVFKSFTHTSFEGQSWSSRNLLSTKDFSTTVQSSRHGSTSDYLRPVNWVLSTVQPTGTVFILLSPHEVNDLLPDIRRSETVHLHQYAPRVTQAMKTFEDLTFHCIPSLSTSWIGPDLGVITRLNLWAGQLYLKNDRAYWYLCNFLGLYAWQPKEDDVIQPDGFIKPEHRWDSRFSTCSFERNPVPYLKILFGSRRKGMDYLPTHIGKILRGRLLTEEDFC